MLAAEVIVRKPTMYFKKGYLLWSIPGFGFMGGIFGAPEHQKKQSSSRNLEERWTLFLILETVDQDALVGRE